VLGHRLPLASSRRPDPARWAGYILAETVHLRRRDGEQGQTTRILIRETAPVQELWRELSRVVLVDRTLEQVLGDITALAAGGIPGAESTSITLIRGDRAFTAAHHGEMALAADELQYERGYGPCMDAGRGNVVLRVDDMREESRWPDYVPRVLETGVRSSLSVPLPFQGSSIGALNVYSTRPQAFATPESLDAGLQVAEAIAVAVVNADAHAQVRDQARNMRMAMDSRAVIEQAKGVLMAQRHVDADQAFDILREASQRYNRKLRDIAEGIVASTQEQPRG
jgi:GAF domain-containing protein